MQAPLPATTVQLKPGSTRGQRGRCDDQTSDPYSTSEEVSNLEAGIRCLILGSHDRESSRGQLTGHQRPHSLMITSARVVGVCLITDGVARWAHVLASIVSRKRPGSAASGKYVTCRTFNSVKLTQAVHCFTLQCLTRS